MMSCIYLFWSAVVLVVVFAICWAPFHIDRVMWSYIDNWSEQNLHAFELVHLTSGVLFYLSSAVNPILYSLMSSRFRGLFREVACRKNEQKFNITQITFRTTVWEKWDTSSCVNVQRQRMGEYFDKFIIIQMHWLEINWGKAVQWWWYQTLRSYLYRCLG